MWTGHSILGVHVHIKRGAMPQCPGPAQRSDWVPYQYCVLDYATWTAVVHGSKLAWASHMGYVGAFAIGTNLLPESKKHTVKAPAGSPELRVHGPASTTALQHIAWRITTD